MYTIGNLQLDDAYGSVVTQTMLGGLTMHHPVANFL